MRELERNVRSRALPRASAKRLTRPGTPGGTSVVPFDEIQVRITKTGHVYVDVRGLPAERVRSIVDYLQEVLGPTVPIDIDPDSMPPQTINLHREQEDEESRREEEQQDRG